MYRVLIVEDEIGTAQPVKEALEIGGIQADIATNGEIGVELFKNNSYDLILLDLEMPIMNGETALKEIRKINPYTQVIIYTNHSKFADVKNLVNLGIDGYISKGADADLKNLVKAIKEKLYPFYDPSDVLIKNTPEMPQA